MEPSGGALSVWSTFLLQLVFLVGLSNAVNLTDGLDGLASGSSILVFS
ncbi:MAG: phospho-N-acetylmuramoyl-pentapeptide-transferase, partial [Chloroflexota bacterium]